jgi:hypothetical protein
MRFWLCVWLLDVVVTFPRAIVAQERDATEPSELSSPLEAARTGAASPLLLNATLGSSEALVIGDGGYDAGRSAALFESAAQVRVWGPVALRAGVIYSDDMRRMRPTFGARVQLLRQGTHGVDGTLSSFYKAEGLNEAAGEIETTFAIGHRFEPFYVLANISYGQDPEGNERDGEIRASVLRPEGRATLGLEARSRSAIGPQHATYSAIEPRLDVVGGAIGMMTVRSVVIFAELGPSAFKLQGTGLRWGVASLGGICAVF